MDKTPKQIRDIQSYIDSIPYGDIDLRIKRVDRKTVQVTTLAEETLRYVDNQEAIRDLDKLITNLIETSFTGEAHVKLEMKDGQIRLLGVFSKKESNY